MGAPRLDGCREGIAPILRPKVEPGDPVVMVHDIRTKKSDARPETAWISPAAWASSNRWLVRARTAPLRVVAATGVTPGSRVAPLRVTRRIVRPLAATREAAIRRSTAASFGDRGSAVSCKCAAKLFCTDPSPAIAHSLARSFKLRIASQPDRLSPARLGCALSSAMDSDSTGPYVM